MNILLPKLDSYYQSSLSMDFQIFTAVTSINLKILFLLEDKDLGRAVQVCQTLNNLCNSSEANFFWEVRYSERFPELYCEWRPAVHWRDWYKQTALTHNQVYWVVSGNDTLALCNNIHQAYRIVAKQLFVAQPRLPSHLGDVNNIRELGVWLQEYPSHAHLSIWIVFLRNERLHDVHPISVGKCTDSAYLHKQLSVSNAAQRILEIQPLNMMRPSDFHLSHLRSREIFGPGVGVPRTPFSYHPNIATMPTLVTSKLFLEIPPFTNNYDATLYGLPHIASIFIQRGRIIADNVVDRRLLEDEFGSCYEDQYEKDRCSGSDTDDENSDDYIPEIRVINTEPIIGKLIKITGVTVRYYGPSK